MAARAERRRPIGAFRVVIVGAGLGGLRCAEALRRAGYAGEVVVVGAEPYLPYSRPPLSKEALYEPVRHERVAFRLRKAVADVAWRLGVAAVGLDRDAGTVALSDGTTLGFDGLVIATGLRPLRLDLPRTPPSPASRRLVLRTLEDAAELQAELRTGARLVVLGAGFVGCELAATAQQLGCTATCVAIDPLPMVRPLGAMLGAELARRHAAHGTRFRLGSGVAALESGAQDGAPHAVVLGTGERLPADLVVEAVGSRCNTEWLDGAGLDLADGVGCANTLRVLDSGGRPVDRIMAVGDVARYPNPLFDDVPRRIEHWSNPGDTAGRAGRVLAEDLGVAGMAGEQARPFAPVPSFWSDQFEIKLHAFGLPELAADGGEARVLEGRLDGEVVVGYLRAGRLVGVVTLGRLPRALAYRDEIAAQGAAGD